MKQRTCRGCGTSFDINPRERNPRQWCSGKCRAWHLKHPDEPRPTDRTCGHCGKGIDHMTISAKWCSPECGYLGRGGGATKEDRQCPVCRKRFTAAGNKRFCSAPCRKAHVNATRRCSLDRLLAEPWSPPTPFDCAQCGTRCVPGENVAAHATKFCGPDCKKASWREDQAGKALLRSFPPTMTRQDEFDFRRVLRRDPCAYCGEPSTQLDHVEPKAHGGSDESANRAGSCAKCNGRKQDMPLLFWMGWKLTHDQHESWNAARKRMLTRHPRRGTSTENTG